MDLLAQPRKRPFALARGFLVIHSAPTALIRHLEWALASVLGSSAVLTWKPQPLQAGTHRATCEWRDREGAGAEIASALRGWHYLRFELREESVNERVLFRYTPELGIHRATLDGAGAVMVSENVIAQALLRGDDEMREVLALNLGTAWELELDPYRRVELEEISHIQAV